MSEHARLSPSSAHRWINCPGSVALSEQVISEHGEYVAGSYALEGTQAHLVAEIQASLAFELVTPEQHAERLLRWKDTTPADRHGDMLRHASAYVALLQQLASSQPHAQVMLEQRVDTGVAASWGTLDAAIISPGHVHVVDYKYGMGVAVDASQNPQLMLYALGGLELFDAVSSPETVCMTIHQPRLGHTSHYCVTPEELRQWRDQVVRPAAALALTDSAYFAPSESACRFCPAAGECQARTKYMARRDFGNPDALSLDEIGELLAKIPDIETWCKAVKDRALDLAYNRGEAIPGWKVIRAGGRRSISDQDKAIEVLVKRGFPEDKVARRSARTLGELERLVGGKTELSKILGSLLVKAAGKEALVPDQDDRPAINSTIDAGKDFSS